jgi:hypothetical protein
MMNRGSEKLAIALVLGIFLSASIILLSAMRHPVTGEEAIEISRNSGLVQEGMATYEGSHVGVTHYNSSWVEQMKQGHDREMYEQVPEGHAIWEVTWTFSPKGGLMIGYTVIVVVDAETGAMAFDTKGLAFG